MKEKDNIHNMDHTFKEQFDQWALKGNDEELWEKINKKVKRKLFLRFKWTRLNIYYVLSIVAITSALLLLNTPGKQINSPEKTMPAREKPANTRKKVPLADTIVQKNATPEKQDDKAVHAKRNDNPGLPKHIPSKEKPETAFSVHPVLTDSNRNKNIIPGDTSSNNMNVQQEESVLNDSLIIKEDDVIKHDTVVLIETKNRRRQR